MHMIEQLFLRFSKENVQALYLMLTTLGGDIHFPELIINKVRGLHFKKFNVIVPTVSMSAGTLTALLADRILTTNVAIFGPVDPQFVVATPYGPRVVSAIAYKKLIEETLPSLVQKQGLGKINLVRLYAAQDLLLYQESLRALEYVEKILERHVKPKTLSDEHYARLVERLIRGVRTHGKPIHARDLREAGLNNIIILDEEKKYKRLLDLIEEYYSYVQKAFLFDEGGGRALYIIGSRYGELKIGGGIKKR